MVTMTVVSSGHPNRAGVLDAARRAAGVEDTRLVRILDVGTQDGNSFIVEETMSGAESLASILAQGPLPAEEARRIAGETARGLEAAGQRGLHHLRLTPHDVLIAPDGAIRVTGVAVAAAIDGLDELEPDASAASRRDAVSLVAVTYAALTGRWPLEREGSGVEPAPRVADGFVAPSEIASGVPDDLDALCRMTLNAGTGPLTPSDVATLIAPWSRDRVRRDSVEPTVAMQLPTLEAGAEHVADEHVADEHVADEHVADQAVSNDQSVGNEPVSATDQVSETTEATETTETTREPDRGRTAGDATPAGAVTTKTADAGAGNGRMAPTRSHLSPFDQIEPPLPLLPVSTALPPSRSQSALVVLFMATFVALSLFVGYCGLRGPISDINLSVPKATARASAPPVKAPTQSARPTASTAAGPVAILSATGFDPEGDRSENSGEAAKVYDGDLETAWSSERYRTDQFGNLKKGVGVLLDLGQPTSVREVTVDLASGPVDVSVYAATKPSLEGATVIDTASAASGRVKLKAAGTMPQAQYVIVWFTSLTQDRGQFSASIAEIALS